MRILAVILSVSCIAGCGSGDPLLCKTDLESIELAHSLTEQQLADLHRQMFQLRSSGVEDDPMVPPTLVPAPISMTYLGDVEVYPFASRPAVELQGCQESDISLIFYGEEEGEPKVVLSWYDWRNPTPGRYVLWRAEG